LSLLQPTTTHLVTGLPWIILAPLDSDDRAATGLSTLTLGEQFVYRFDFGDSWTHPCSSGPARIAPEAEVASFGRTAAVQVGSWIAHFRIPLACVCLGRCGWLPGAMRAFMI
jgi:hypothetical protein